jgi:sulfur-carrier protein adenylyltransferase/sulfurtransferase
MKEITPEELKSLKEQGAPHQLIDVREPYEAEICEIGGELIPMGEVMDHVDKISRDIKVVVHCRSGKRSAAVIESLEKMHGFSNLYNLAGGILAYADRVDSSLSHY